MFKEKSIIIAVAASLLCTSILAAKPTKTVKVLVNNPTEARIYKGRLDYYNTINVYTVEDLDLVPYVSATEYLRLLFGDSVSARTKSGGKQIIFSRNGAEVIFDMPNATITFTDWDAFFATYTGGKLHFTIIPSSELNAIRLSGSNAILETESHPFTINLADYNLNLVFLEKDILAPFAVLENIFTVPVVGRNAFSYNGKDFYDLNNTIDYIYGHLDNPDITLNPYSTAYYSGPFSQLKEMPKPYVEYAYETTCLLFDYFYGHKEEKGIESFDSYLEQIGLKEGMLSTDPEVSSETFAELIYKVFDSGHDSVKLSHSVFNSATFTNSTKIITTFGGIPQTEKALADIIHEMDKMGVDYAGGQRGTYAQYEKAVKTLKFDPIILSYIFREDKENVFEPFYQDAVSEIKEKNLSEEQIKENKKNARTEKYGTESNSLIDSAEHINAIMPEEYQDGPRIDIEDDTAFIYFNDFANRIPMHVFYTHTPNESAYEQSSFGLFYAAFEKIKANPKVKNVVIDLSANGGGAVTAMISLLGFLSPNGEVMISYYHIIDRHSVSEWYQIDTNLDGKFDENDGYGGKYNFYFITSPFSYSCGTAMPFYAQKYGWAKVIGLTPGGGDCMVTEFMDAYGHVAKMSGFLKFGLMDDDGIFVTDEHEVDIDIPFGEKADMLYFNRRKIVDFIHKNQ